MTTIPIISLSKELHEVCHRISKNAYVAVDTEFMREKTYWPELCLIQVASEKEAFIIDPLSNQLDLEPFFQLMANQNILKVFHSARQDLEIILKLGEIIPKPLFDTQIAAMVCGYGDAVSYDFLVDKLCGRKIDKSHRFTNWKLRPLSYEQKAYALDDVTYLCNIYKELYNELEVRGRTLWVKEEIEQLLNPKTYIVLPEHAWQRLRLRAKRPIELAITQSITKWREIEAKRRNVPRGKILKDEIIFELAAQKPSTLNDLNKMRKLPQGFSKSKYAQDLVNLVKKANTIPKDQLPPLPKKKQTGNSKIIVELLKVLLKIISQEKEVAPKIIATTDDLEKIAESDIADVPALKGWRKVIFGNLALQLKAGQVGIGLSDTKKIKLFPISKQLEI